MEIKKEQQLVSVIIPCFNQGHYLYEVTDSILNQTYDNFEIIIINDGSTDEDTKRILSTFARPKTRIVNQSNTGLAQARNIGIENSLGDYIIPLDCDDKIAASYISDALEVFEHNPEIDLVYTNIKVFGDYDDIVQLKQVELPALLIQNNISVTACYKKEVFKKIKSINGYGYNPNMRLGYEDWDFWIAAAALNFKFKYLDNFTFLYRKHGHSMIDKATVNNGLLYKTIMNNQKETFQKYQPELILQMQEELISIKQKENKLLADIKEFENKNKSLSWIIKRFFKLILIKLGLSKD